jgi:uncharacterized membrane protein
MDKLIKALVIFFILDMIYINFFIKTPFNKMIKNIQGSSIDINIYSAGLCYLVLFYSFYHFILKKNFKSKNERIKEAFILGFCIYAVYDLTNHATIKNWSNYVVIIDSIWGGILFALTAYLIN